MRIMVMKCTVKGAFYEQKIGKIYSISESQGDCYIVITKDQGGRFGKIKKTDAEVIGN